MDFPAWDPVLLPIPGLPIDVRWYGLMYVVGFLCGQWILVRLARAGVFPVAPERAPDLIVYLVFGVLLGGRVGYALFYDQELLNPVNFVQVWKGGLSFHGGLGGVAIAGWLFARSCKIPWLRVADACALAVTPGIFAVRFANFINGELYGRITEKGVGWAMQFPTDPVAMRVLHLSDAWTMRDRELCIQYAFRNRTWESIQGQLSTVDDTGRTIDWAAIQPHLDWAAVRDQVPYRHPSQLYEGIGEGLVLGLVLLGLYLLLRNRSLRRGTYAAVFLLGYAAVRFSLEFVRQPDAQFGPGGTVLLGMTMGQTLSTAMVVGAALILWFGGRPEPPRARPPQSKAESEPGTSTAASPQETTS
ncbi:MAG: prolipoprotein diacylglyceryl transferase [Planctomycetota bacterium]